MTPDLLIQHGTLLDAESGETRHADVRIQNGVIVQIAPGLESSEIPTYDARGRVISQGWTDMHAHFREPGFEHKETIETGCRAAAFGGFTAVACMPNTQPPIDTREVVESIIERAAAFPVDVHPIACVSRGRAGRELADMGELSQSGAVAFSDDGAPVQNGGLMRRALEYASMLGRAIINHMEDLTMGPKGHMHEGVVSTRLGVTPVPALSEESMIARDLLLAELTGAHLHVAHISTGRSVGLVRQAKQRAVSVTAEICPHHFAWTDEAVERTGFSTLTKMHPPLRTAADVEAIKDGLRDGAIDVICTDHAPHASFEKEVEFTAAPFGIIGLETAWGLTGRHLIDADVLTLAQAVFKLSVAPRRILRLPALKLAVGEAANLTIFDATTHWTFETRHIHSKSSNTPFVGEPMIGKAWAIYNKGQLVNNTQNEIGG